MSQSLRATSSSCPGGRALEGGETPADGRGFDVEGARGSGESLQDPVQGLGMPLVRTPMIEPTKAFRDVPALRPDEAADLVLRALVTRESHIGTRVAALFDLGHMIAPEAVERMMGLAQELVSSPA